MQHPFVQDLSEKTLEELQTTIASLTTKLTFAYRTHNGPLIHQLNMILESYRYACSNKIDQMLDKQKVSTKISVEKK